MASTGPRPRRFSLPELADERVDEAVKAFVEGPAQDRGRRAPVVPLHAADNPFAALETRMAWMEALRRESARTRRYRRSAAVIVVAAVAARPDAVAHAWLGRVAGPIAHALRRTLRETDLVMRASDARFHVLLPETTGREAQKVADRVVADCQVWLRAVDAPVIVKGAAAGTGHDTTLEGALERALSGVGVGPTG